MPAAAGRPGTWALAVALALSACGGDGGEGKAPPGQPVATISVRETEFKLDPANPRIDKPGVVEFRAQNAGQTIHALEVEGPKGEVETEPIQPGESATLRADLSEPGEYTWYCPVGDHKYEVIEGKITVAGG